MQSRPASLVGRVDFGAMREKELSDCLLAITGCGEKRRRADLVPSVNLGTTGDEQPDYGPVAEISRLIYRRLPLAVTRVNVRPMSEQQFDRLVMPQVGREVERADLPAVWAVDTCAL